VEDKLKTEVLGKQEGLKKKEKLLIIKKLNNLYCDHIL